MAWRSVVLPKRSNSTPIPGTRTSLTSGETSVGTVRTMRPITRTRPVWPGIGKAKAQRIHRQKFDVGEVAVRGVKARGKHMTSKTIASFHEERPKGWSDKRAGSTGSFIDI